ncbi:hypothetical protein [Fimbriimonas ginsengisoli]|uniref:Glycosyltransferase RgtA/B/C/D-like domain-containing protein n=1 Tax=Fimbriimonas ginsengisoli Gsoil 348 TaxID=661478 RepID=A0A068NZ84_FIMGI|nr:hypothetical protein [Fimbriimonas ginsengisoli]AIE88129.1 hypothetical protein OP10G_4761 [Fimbriimonas ginsengisoli Gsoil 348]
MAQIDADGRRQSETKFVWFAVIVAVLFAAFPAIYGALSAPSGSRYVGYQYNTDDHMVYAAWMRQAMDGHLFFDNRFTTDPQPGLTVHLYFFVLGLIAKVTGIAVAATLGRLGFSALFIWLAYRLARRVTDELFAARLAVALTIIGGGLGFLYWHNFGPEGPVDIWQPEGFVFPSMLTNGLFMVSLCLILTTFQAFLDARTSWRAAGVGAVAIGLLMNIHSYDVLMVALVMVGFLGAALVQRQVTRDWLLRSAVIVAGVLPAALWFKHVLDNDPVFQARAATETYSPNFRQVVPGYLVLMLFAFVGAAMRTADAGTRKRRVVGIALAILLFAGMYLLASNHTGGYFMGIPAFAGALLLAIAAVTLASDESPGWNLLFSWAVIGTVAVYFPGLFQRKLTMGLSVPWAILAAFGLHSMLRTQERSVRNLVVALCTILLGATSVRWLARELQFIGTDVSNTTRHPVYLETDVVAILDYLNSQPGKKVLLALPGTPAQARDSQTGNPIPDTFLKPVLPDLAPFASGLTGAYTYAGHWSETPNYTHRAGEMYRFFLREPLPQVRNVMSDEERTAFARGIHANYAILPAQETVNYLPLVTAEQLGEVVVKGSRFSLVKLRE